LSQDRSI